MTNEELAQAIIVVGASAIAGYAIYAHFKRDRFEFDEMAPEWAYDDFYERFPEEDFDEAYDEEFAEPEPSRWREHGARAGAFAVRAGKTGWGYAREKAPVVGAYAKRAGGWAGEGVKSAYEASRRYDYRGGARRLGEGAMKVGSAMDALSYMDAPKPFVYPPSPVPALPASMQPAPRHTVFGAPAPEAFDPIKPMPIIPIGNKRRRRHRR